MDAHLKGLSFLCKLTLRSLDLAIFFWLWGINPLQKSSAQTDEQVLKSTGLHVSIDTMYFEA